MEKLWRAIAPNAHHDWINQRNVTFLNYLPLGDDDSKRNKGSTPAVFTLYSSGVKTNRDAWAYNFSKENLAENMQKTIAFYNSEVERYRQACEGKIEDERPDVKGFVRYDSTQIHWADLTEQVIKNKTSQFSQENLRHGIYRPFCKRWLYFDPRWNTRRYQQPNIFPNPDIKNLTICVTGIGAGKGFSALMVDTVPNLHFMDTSQCFPRYRYLPADGQGRQAALEMDEAKHTRVDNIPQETVSRFREHYRSSAIDADAIFYYIYGLLHCPGYKTRFAADLKKMLPRIPLVKSPEEFWGFSEAGRTLAELHVGYEDVEGWPLTVTVKEKENGVQGTPDDEELYRVSKMRFGGAARSPDKTVIRYNGHITVEGIPLEAYEYIVNGKSAIEWVMERYQVTQHKDSRIINDPNDWSDDPRYILALLGKVVTVSMKVVEIVSGLPKLDET